MKIILYSGDSPSNTALDRELIRLVDRPRPKVVFVAADPDAAAYDFGHFSEQMLSLCPATIRLLEPYQKLDAEALTELAKCDLIYLSGGNTFHLLKHLRRNKLLGIIRDYVRRGGVLAGQSAGSIVMTPSICAASYPKFDRDDNEVNLDDLSALHLVNFEFFPHYSDDPDYSKVLKKQSRKLRHPLYAVADGGGIVINDNLISFAGDVWCFARGKKFKITP